MPNQTQASITAASTCWRIQMPGWCSSFSTNFHQQFPPSRLVNRLEEANVWSTSLSRSQVEEFHKPKNVVY